MEKFTPTQDPANDHSDKSYVRPSQILKDSALTCEEKALALKEWEEDEKALLRADDENMAAMAPAGCGPAPEALLKDIQAAARKLEEEGEPSSGKNVGTKTTFQEKPMTPQDDFADTKELKKKAKDILPETQELREEISTLRSNVVGLARHLKDVSAESATAAAEYVRDQVGELKTTGAAALGKAEKRIQANPGQSVAIAFIAGIMASFIFGRKA